MANFDQLKQSVAALIRTNGAEEITGQIMQDVLLTIINSISGGYMFGGVAQHNGNVGNPDYNVFYLAGSGAYTGYGGAITIEAGCYGVFRYNGVWTQEVVDIGVRLSGSIAEGETRGVTGDVINTALQTLFENVMNILDTLTFSYNTPSAEQATKAMLDVIMTPTGGASHVFATLTLASATVAAAGLMSAEDKQKVDRMLTDFRSLSFSDTTAVADQATKIVQTLSATLGENPEAITTMTFLAATASKAGLMSAADKAVLDCLVAMVGYYECPTIAGTAAKEVSASGYSLTSGGCIRIKMNNANTANNVTLNINSTGAKALYYDGAQASSTNTWEAGEVLEVYYDGTQYQCASGGGKSDTSTVAEVVYSDGYNNISFLIDPNGNKWRNASSSQASKIIPIPTGIVGIKMKPTSNVMMWSLLSSYVPATNGGSVRVATGLDGRYSSSEEVKVTNLSNATILCVRADTGQTNAECPIIEWLYDADNWKTPEEYLEDSVSELYEYAVDIAQTMPFGSLAAGYVEDNGKWMRKTSDNTHLSAHYKIAVTSGNAYKVKAGMLDSVLYWSSTGNDSNVVDNTDADIIGTKMTVKSGMQSIFQAPSGANYLYVMAAYYTGNIAPLSVAQVASSIDMTDIAPYYIVEGAQPVDISGLTKNACTMGTGGTWQVKNVGKHVVLPVNAGEKYVIVGDGNGFFGFLTSSYSAPVTERAAIPFVAGTQRTLQKDAQCVTIPQGTAYLCFVVVNGGGGIATWSIYKVASYKRRLSNITKFRMAHWNIGGFLYTDWHVGDPTHQIPAADAATYAQKYRELINSINADVFGIAEYKPSFSAASLVTKDVIFQCYREIHEGHVNGANSNTLMSNICEWVGYEEVSFTASEYNRYYTHATVRMNGDNVHIVEAHLDHTYNAMREAEIAQLINDLGGYEYVIIAGDFNTGDEETIETELAAFTNAGFKMLNDGYLGLVVTSLTEEYVDNICVKGFSMQNINVSPADESGTLSDHLLIYCDLTMQD